MDGRKDGAWEDEAGEGRGMVGGRKEKVGGREGRWKAYFVGQKSL